MEMDSKEIQSRVENYREELLTRLGEVVAINSEEGKPLPDAPFGEGPKKALLKVLDYLKEDGFRTTNLDNYIGYGEIGEGEEMIAVVGHLDVVPAKKEDGWTDDPYTMVIRDGNVYGRGVADDKGAVIASLTALKILRDMGVPFKRRVRLICGTNEESGSRCLKYYVEHDEQPVFGFTPDADFPGVFAEKGMIGAVYRSKETGIVDIQGGSVANVVCGKCSIVVKKCTFSRKALDDYFNNRNIDYEITEEGDNVRITVMGTAAHASTPELGVNAIAYLMDGLTNAGFQDPFVEFYMDHFGLGTDGEKCGIKCADEYGDLTLNTGVIHMKDGVIEGTIDIRFPASMSTKMITKMWQDHLEDENGVIVLTGHGCEPLFYPVDSPLVESLVEAYREATGDEETQPLCIGGGTYAKGLKNTIAFGCSFLDKDYRLHNVDEWCPIDDLMKQVEIYVYAILKLLEA